MQSKSLASAKEMQSFRDELEVLESKVASLSLQLKEEKEKCQLLVDYPSLPHSSDSNGQSKRHTLSAQESQKQISANTIRILLLEEQNSELRESLQNQTRNTSKSICKAEWDITTLMVAAMEMK